MQSGKPDDEKELAAAGKQFVAATQEVMSDIFRTGRPFSETVPMIHQLVDKIDELMSKGLTDVLGEVVEKLKAKGVKIEVKYIKPSSNESLPSDQN